MSFRCWFCKESAQPGKSLALVVTKTRTRIDRNDREIVETAEEKPWCGCEEGLAVARKEVRRGEAM